MSNSRKRIFSPFGKIFSNKFYKFKKKDFCVKNAELENVDSTFAPHFLHS